MSVMLDTYASEMISALINEGQEGGTVDRMGDALPTAGYWVGGVVPSLVIADYSESAHSQAIRQFVESAPTRYVGFWYDRADGKLYVDAVDHVASCDLAEETGRARGEIAIWDIAAQDEIRL